MVYDLRGVYIYHVSSYLYNMPVLHENPLDGTMSYHMVMQEKQQTHVAG